MFIAWWYDSQSWDRFYFVCGFFSRSWTKWPEVIWYNFKRNATGCVPVVIYLCLNVYLIKWASLQSQTDKTILRKTSEILRKSPWNGNKTGYCRDSVMWTATRTLLAVRGMPGGWPSVLAPHRNYRESERAPVTNSFAVVVFTVNLQMVFVPWHSRTQTCTDGIFL